MFTPPAVDADFLGRLVDGVAQLPGPVVLVLDDIQDVGTGLVLDGVAFLLRHLPRQLLIELDDRQDSYQLKLMSILCHGRKLST